MDNILKDFIEYYEFKYDQQPLIVKETKIDVLNKKQKKLPQIRKTNTSKENIDPNKEKKEDNFKI